MYLDFGHVKRMQFYLNSKYMVHYNILWCWELNLSLDKQMKQEHPSPCVNMSKSPSADFEGTHMSIIEVVHLMKQTCWKLLLAACGCTPDLCVFLLHTYSAPLETPRFAMAWLSLATGGTGHGSVPGVPGYHNSGFKQRFADVGERPPVTV